MFIAFYHNGRNYIYGLYIFLNCVIRSTVINLRDHEMKKFENRLSRIMSVEFVWPLKLNEAKAEQLLRCCASAFEMRNTRRLRCTQHFNQLVFVQSSSLSIEISDRRWLDRHCTSLSSTRSNYPWKGGYSWVVREIGPTLATFLSKSNT